MDANAVLGLGHRNHERRVAEIVVARFPEGHVLGLAVDVISRIQSVRTSDLRPAAPLLDRSAPLVSATVTEDSGRQIFILDHARLTADATLLAMAELSDPARTGTDPAPPDQAQRQPDGIPPDEEVVRERARHLTFEAGGTFASPITQIVRILEPPGSVTPVESARGVDGFFTVDGQITPLVCLARALGRSPGADVAEQDRRERILLVGDKGAQVGFRVGRVTGIEASNWRTTPPAGEDVAGGLVNLSTASGPRVLPRIDLDALICRLGGALAA